MTMTPDQRARMLGSGDPTDQPAAPAPVLSVSLLSRLKLTEPVRLYVYSVLVVLTAAAQLAGWLTGEWQQFIEMNGAVILAVGAGAEAARASVYSPRTMVRGIMRATRQ